VKDKPIGIFDSGLGGITVLRSLLEKFPNESFIYIGDLARLPYGNKSPDTIRKYGEQILNYLNKMGTKAVVIACNSASTVFLGEDSYNGIPLFNVIEPGANLAAKTTKNNKVAVMSTTATMKAHAYKKELLKCNPNLLVEEKATPLLVPLAEEGWLHEKITKDIIQKYLNEIELKFDTLILGCTHYPILRDDIKNCLSPDIMLIESGDALAINLDEKLKLLDLKSTDSNHRTIQILTTDLTEHFETLAHNLVKPYKINSFERITL
jgi:glutamate racemase